MTEAQLQAGLMEAARLHGWLVFHVHDSRRQVKPGVHVGDRDAAGFPDLLLVHPARKQLAAFECKNQTRQATHEQIVWLGALEAVGVEARLVRPCNYDDAIAYLAEAG